MARNLDIAALRSFLAVTEAGGVTRAAQRLHLTQSAVSMQLKRLESALGVQLLAREGRGVVLTREGEELAAQARPLVAMNDEIWRRMTAPVSQGTVVLGIPHDIIHPFASEIMRTFSANFPDVKLSLVSYASARLHQLLREGAVDVIVTTDLEVCDGGETLSTAPLVWLGAPDSQAWRRRPTPLAFERECCFREAARQALERAGAPWEWRSDVGSCEAAYACAAADLAVTVMVRGTQPSVLTEIEHGGGLPPLPPTYIDLHVTRGPNAELAERLAGYVRAAYRGAGAEGARAA